MKHLVPMIVVLATSAPASGSDVDLGPWYVIGPFKDSDFGIVAESLNFPFEPETNALDYNGIPLLQKVYRARKWPGMVDTDREWMRREGWIDGYSVLLPRGPAPSRNETVYLYRRLTVLRDRGYVFHILAADAARMWVDGRQIGQCLVNNTDTKTHSFSRIPVRLDATVPLSAGEHHILIKSTSRFSTHTFSFAMPPFTQSFDEPRSVQPAPVLNEQAQWATQTVTDESDLRRLQAFRFALQLPPMYGPCRSVLDEKLTALPPTPEAAAYAEDMAALQKVVLRALSANDAAQIRTAVGAISEFWCSQMAELPPIAFLRTAAPRPENAVVPLSKQEARGQGEICIWDPRRPHEKPRVLFGPARIWDLNISRDGTRLLFSASGLPQARPGSEQFCLFSLDIGSPAQPGTGEPTLRQITDGHAAGGDISPCELPSGEIAFVSTRTDTLVICQGGPTHSLFVCNADGSHIRRISGNIDTDHYPQVLNDGRILFTRWDYGVEKNVFNRHALWTIAPDGSSLGLYFGNAVMSPNAFWKARPIPGRPEIVCVFGAHHSNQAGMLGLVWNHAGTEAERGTGFRYVTTERPVQGDMSHFRDYRDPFPVHERLFLAAQGSSLPRGIGLWLVDSFGNRKCLYAPPGGSCCLYPLLVKPAPAAPIIPSSLENPEFAEICNSNPESENAWEQDTDNWAILTVQDVYRGLAGDIRRGEAKSIQVIEQVFRPQNTNTKGTRGIVVLPSNGTAHVRRIIGTVPVEDDGSATFKVPPLRSISFNLLDKDGKLLMRMGSDLHVMPRERRSCVGCHESREHIAVAPSATGHVPLAMNKPPSLPQRPDWTADGLIDYRRHIQPIFDKYCVDCHSGTQPKACLDLTGDRTRFFCMSYDSLLNRELVDWHSVAGGDSGHNTPKAIGSAVSKLCQYLEAQKCCPQAVPAAERRRIYNWIDANVPFYSTYVGDPDRKGGHDGWYFEEDFERSYERRCMACHEQRLFNQSMNGGWATVYSSQWSARAITANNIQGNCRLSTLYGPDHRINISNPEHSAFVLAPLAKESGGWELCKQKSGIPVFLDRSDVDYQVFVRNLHLSRQNAARQSVTPGHRKGNL